MADEEDTDEDPIPTDSDNEIPADPEESSSTMNAITSKTDSIPATSIENVEEKTLTPVSSVKSRSTLEESPAESAERKVSDEVPLRDKQISLDHMERDKTSQKGKISRFHRQCQRRFHEIIGKRELKNEELEQQEGNLRHRLNMLECSMPAVMVWNIWRMSQGSSVPSLQQALEKQFQGPASGEIYCPRTPSRHFDCRVREVEAERKQAENRAEEARSLWTEKLAVLEEKQKKLEEAKKIQEERKNKIQQLTVEAEKLREAANKVQDDGSCETGDCAAIECKKKWLEKVPSNTSIKSTDIECLEKLQQLAEAELSMKRQIADLERREDAYMRTLQQADEMWSKIGGDTASTVSGLQEQLDQKTAANQQMADRISELEDDIEKLKARLACCRSELEKFLSIDKIEALIGRDDDFAEVKDEETFDEIQRMHRMAGSDDDLDMVEKEAVARPDVADSTTGVDRHDLISVEHVELEIHPEDFTYEERRLQEAKEYLARLGSLSELDVDDDYICPPDFACNNVVFTETGLTEEELAALDANEVTAEMLLGKHAAAARQSAIEEIKMESSERVGTVVQQADGEESVIKDVEEILEDGLPVDIKEERTIETVEEEAVTGFSGEESSLVEEISFGMASPVASKEKSRSVSEEILSEEKEEEKVIADEVDDETVEANRKDVLILLSELESWQDNLDIVRVAIAKCPQCRPVKKDADNLIEMIAAYTGREVKPVIEEDVPFEEELKVEEEIVLEELMVEEDVDGKIEVKEEIEEVEVVEKVPEIETDTIVGAMEEEGKETDTRIVSETAVAESDEVDVFEQKAEIVDDHLPTKLPSKEEDEKSEKVAEETVSKEIEVEQIKVQEEKVVPVEKDEEEKPEEEADRNVPSIQEERSEDEKVSIREEDKIGAVPPEKAEAPKDKKEIPSDEEIEDKKLEEELLPDEEKVEVKVKILPAKEEEVEVEVELVSEEEEEIKIGVEAIEEAPPSEEEAKIEVDVYLEEEEFLPVEEDVEVEVEVVLEKEEEDVEEIGLLEEEVKIDVEVLQEKEEEIEIELEGLEEEELEVEIKEDEAEGMEAIPEDEVEVKIEVLPEELEEGEEEIPAERIEESEEEETKEVDEEVTEVPIMEELEEITPEKPKEFALFAVVSEDEEFLPCLCEESEPELQPELEPERSTEDIKDEESVPCLCNVSEPEAKSKSKTVSTLAPSKLDISSAKLQEPPRKIEITQTEFTEIIKIETSQVITQTVSDVHTQTLPAQRMIRRGQRSSLIPGEMDPDQEILERLTSWKNPFNDQGTLTTTSMCCQTETSSLIRSRTRKDESHASCIPISHILQSLKADLKLDPEQELRSIHYGRKPDEKGQCNCCTCGKTVPSSGGLLEQLLVPKIPSSAPPFGRIPSIDKTKQHEAFCPECKISRLQDSLRSQDSSTLSSTQQQDMQGEERCNCAPPMSKTTQRQTADQGCMAKIPRLRMQQFLKKELTIRKMKIERTENKAQSEKEANTEKRAVKKDPSIECICTESVENGSPGVAKKMRCACGDPD